jgi:hypothetical protein
MLRSSSGAPVRAAIVFAVGCLWVCAASGVALAGGVAYSRVAVTGDPAAGAGPGMVYSRIFVGDINDLRLVTFPAQLVPAGSSGPVVNATLVRGVEGGRGAVLVRGGDPAPGGPFTFFSGLGETPNLDEVSGYAVNHYVTG